MRPLLFIAAFAVALATTAAVANADRKPTHKERRAIAKTVGLPPGCAAVRSPP